MNINNKVDDIIRKARRGKTSEIFSPEWLISELLDKLPDNQHCEDTQILDPSAGSGNILVTAYRWKVDELKHDPTKALSTLFGVEIMKDNTAEIRMRLYYLAKGYGVDPMIAEEILMRNIVCHDALSYDYSFT